MTDVDSCLFILDKCICLVYVDDTLFFSPKSEYIDKAIMAMRESGRIELEREESIAGFLRVHIKRDERSGTIQLTQTGLTKRIIEALNTTTTKPILQRFQNHWSSMLREILQTDCTAMLPL